jgi:hypothetical protein
VRRADGPGSRRSSSRDHAVLIVDDEPKDPTRRRALHRELRDVVAAAAKRR